MPEHNLEAHLSYLREKGYLALDRRKGSTYEIAFASLTATGWDLLDGLRTDGGVDTRL